MFKDFERSKLNTYDQTRRELSHDGLPESLQTAFDSFAELSPKSQQAILEKISAMKQELNKPPRELLNEVRTLVSVYRTIENHLSRAEETKTVVKVKGLVLEHEEEIVEESTGEFVQRIENLFEAKFFDARLLGVKAVKQDDNKRRGHGSQKPTYKNIPRDTPRHPETMPESEL